MISKGFSGPIEDIEARIQADVGEFLSAKKKLIEIQSRSLDLDIKQEASDLLATQLALEERLPNVIALIDKVKTNVYTISDIVSAGAFLAQMERQIYNVRRLMEDYQRGSKKAEMTGLEYLVLALVGGGVLYGITKSRRG